MLSGGRKKFFSPAIIKLIFSLWRIHLNEGVKIELCEASHGHCFPQITLEPWGLAGNSTSQKNPMFGEFV